MEIPFLVLSYIEKTDIGVDLLCWNGPTDAYPISIENWQLGYDFFEKSKNIFRYPEYTDEESLKTYIYLVEKIEKWKERKVKGQHGIRLTPSTLCNICKHRISYTTCKAFPSGIPKELHNKLHTEKLPTQKNDIVFELGEEGSKNAGIKPIREFGEICGTTNERFHQDFEKLTKGEKEETYIDKSKEEIRRT